MSDIDLKLLPWWKAKEISLKRKAAAAVRPACAEVGDAILIVTEGEVSEPVYFELLRESLQLSTVTVKVISGKASDPAMLSRPPPMWSTISRNEQRRID